MIADEGESFMASLQQNLTNVPGCTRLLRNESRAPVLSLLWASHQIEDTSFTMKFAILIAFAGSATAFAPATQGGTFQRWISLDDVDNGIPLSCTSSICSNLYIVF